MDVALLLIFLAGLTVSFLARIPHGGLVVAMIDRHRAVAIPEVR